MTDNARRRSIVRRKSGPISWEAYYGLRRRDPLTLAAVHEAGHSSAARHYGYPVRSAGIAADGTGLTTVGASSGPSHALARAVVCLAGPVAEAWYLGLTELDPIYGALDVERARAELRASCFDLRYALDTATDVVDARWGDVLRVAIGLLRDRGEQ